MLADDLLQYPAVARLHAAHPESILEGAFARKELTLVIAREAILPAARLLRDDLGYDLLSDITCVDWYPLDPRFEVVYHLYATASHQFLRLKVRAGVAQEVASLIPVWPSANWFEREVWDLFGVRFTGHPELQRMLMPNNWEGHPLRKDYPVEGYR
ncbi:MAG: NADH-quinone oxidoreductase subunit C [Terriglobales bacterium]